MAPEDPIPTNWAAFVVDDPPVFTADNKSAVARALTAPLYRELCQVTAEAQGWSLAEAITGTAEL